MQSKEGNVESEFEPLNPIDYSQDVHNIAPSAPIQDEPPNYASVAPQQQPYNPQHAMQQQQVIITPMNPNQPPLHDENQPLHPPPNADIPLDNMTTPSQDQIAAVLPSFDNQPSQSNTSGVGYIAGCKQSPNVITWTLTISIWTLLVLGIVGAFIEWEHIWFILLIIAAVLYVLSLVETRFSAIYKYLSNILEQEGAIQYIERLKRTPIQIWWTVRCYHWETRTRVVHETDSNGHSRTRHETYREKVYTWHATQQYVYSVCVDISGDIEGLDEYELTRLRLHKAYQFGNDETKQHYVNTQEMFKRNNWRDSHQEFSEETKIGGYIERLLAEREPGTKPNWMDVRYLWLFSVFGFSPCYRQKLVAHCGNIDFALVKQIAATIM